MILFKDLSSVAAVGLSMIVYFILVIDFNKKFYVRVFERACFDQFFIGTLYTFQLFTQIRRGGDEVANLILLANNLAQQKYPRAYVGY
jgi:hypothetical protein